MGGVLWVDQASRCVLDVTALIGLLADAGFFRSRARTATGNGVPRQTPAARSSRSPAAAPVARVRP
jgi:hypothetical protein